MSKILIIDSGAVGLGLALRAAEAGHMVNWFVEPKPENVADKVGLDVHSNIKKVTEWTPYVMDSDLVISTENGKFVERLDGFKKRGARIYTPTEESVKLEIDRAAGMKFLEDHGIQVPEYKIFSNLDKAAAYIKKNPGPWVIKPAGDNDNKALSFVSKDDEEMLRQFEVWKRQGEDLKGSVFLQKRVFGIEMAVCGWVGFDGFVGPFSESFEHKKLMNRDYGPNTGEMGTVIKYVKKSKLADKILKPLEKDLVKMGCLTSLDINCIIDDEGNIHPLEFTARFGWPATNLLMFLQESDPVEFMMDALDGVDNLEVDSDNIGICVLVAIPDFPYGNFDSKQTVGLPIDGINEENFDNIYPQSMMMQDGEWVTAGDYVMVVCAKGASVKEAQRAVYKIIDDLKIPNMIVRTDIGNRVIKALPKLQELGFATDF